MEVTILGKPYLSCFQVYKRSHCEKHMNVQNMGKCLILLQMLEDVIVLNGEGSYKCKCCGKDFVSKA